MDSDRVVYAAPPTWKRHLAEELGRLSGARRLSEDIWMAPTPTGQPGDPVWFRNIWYDPQILSFRSVSEAACLLRERNGLWVEHLVRHFRRGQLIKERLPPFRSKPLFFPQPLPKAVLGAWTLLDEHTLLCAPSTFSPFPGGRAEFASPQDTPPSAAYAKLQEALILMRHFLGVFPQPGERCLDLGASPGGWTWVLAGLGCEVLAVDRSPLDPKLSENPRIGYLQGDGFKVHPARVQREGWYPFNWVVSDMAAYPAKVLDWVGLWLQSPDPPNMVVTLKMKGEPDWVTLRAFQRIPGGLLLHLSHNKHEITWMRGRGSHHHPLQPWFVPPEA